MRQRRNGPPSAARAVRLDRLTFALEGSKIGANLDAPANWSRHTRAVALSVMIVDDDSGFRHRARRLLAVAGYAVAGEAADGASAIAGVRELQPDVLLLDILLPDIDGIEVAGRLSAESDGGPAVVLTSSRDAADYGRRLRDAVVAGFIPKAELSAASLAAVLGARP